MQRGQHRLIVFDVLDDVEGARGIELVAPGNAARVHLHERRPRHPPRSVREAFGGRLEGLTTLGEREAVITSVAGRGFVTGHHRFVIDERDPLRAGFLLR